MRRAAAVGCALFLVTAQAAVAPLRAAEAMPGGARIEQAASNADLDRVRSRLAHAARIGSDGEPHLLVTFDTRACGVRLSHRMRAQYPKEMTIVLQYQFERLVVTRSGFEVDLWFSGRRERVRVPFSAMTAFHEPPASYVVKFVPKQLGGCGLQAGIASRISARR